MRKRAMRRRIRNLEALDRINQVVIEGARSPEHARYERDMGLLRAALNREPLTIAGVRYVPDRDPAC